MTEQPEYCSGVSEAQNQVHGGRPYVITTVCERLSLELSRKVAGGCRNTVRVQYDADPGVDCSWQTVHRYVPRDEASGARSGQVREAVDK